MTRGDVVLAFGSDATKKTWTMMDAVHALSKGEPFWGNRFTPKQKTKILYFYADRSKTKFIGDYLKPFASYDPDYLQYIYVKDLWRINPDLRFDISTPETWSYITQMVIDFKPDLVVFDSWHGCGPSSNVYDKNQMAEFMSYLVRFSNIHQLVSWIIHHANKQNTKDTRGKILEKDDYQGAKCISSLMAYTFVINIVPNSLGKFSFDLGKRGLTDFPSFFYSLENHYDENKKHTAIMHYEDFDPQKMADEIIKNNYETHKMEMVNYIKNDSKSSLEIKQYFHVGKAITQSLYWKYSQRLLDDDIIVGFGLQKSVRRMYKLTPKGKSLIGGVPPPAPSPDITHIPIDVVEPPAPPLATESVDLSVPLCIPDSTSVSSIMKAKEFSERATAIESSINLERPRMLTLDASKINIKTISDFETEYQARKVILDIESEGASAEHYDTNKIFCIGLKTSEKTIIIENGDDEKLMLTRFNDLLKQLVGTEYWICGHNILSYDLPHIIARMKVHGIISPLHFRTRMNGQLCEWHHDFKNGVSTYNIPDCGALQFVDTLFLVHLYDMVKSNLSGYGLKVCAIELGCRETERLDLSFSEILDAWKNDKEKLFKYLRFDLDDTDFLAHLLLPNYYYMEAFV
jgi:hypothetical protein